MTIKLACSERKLICEHRQLIKHYSAWNETTYQRWSTPWPGYLWYILHSHQWLWAGGCHVY